MELTNSAQISSYTYPISPSISGSGTAVAESITIDILPATVNFTKTNTPSYIEPGNTVTLTYEIQNLNMEDIISAEIIDTVLNMQGVSAKIINGGTINGNTITVTLSPTLKQNETTHVVVSLAFDPTAVPDKILYDTVATANLLIATEPISSTTKTSKGYLEVNSANVSLNKSISPSITTVTAGNLLTFSIEFANSGNVDAIIGIGQFSDSWSAGRLTNVTPITPGFNVSGSRITNNIVLTIPAASSKTLVYTAISL